MPCIQQPTVTSLAPKQTPLIFISLSFSLKACRNLWNWAQSCLSRNPRRIANIQKTHGFRNAAEWLKHQNRQMGRADQNRKNKQIHRSAQTQQAKQRGKRIFRVMVRGGAKDHGLSLFEEELSFVWNERLKIACRKKKKKRNTSSRTCVNYVNEATRLKHTPKCIFWHSTFLIWLMCPVVMGVNP